MQYVKDNERPWLHRASIRHGRRPQARQDRVANALAAALRHAGPIGRQSLCCWLVRTALHRADNFRGVRLELYREFAHPAPGCPRFCAVSAADASAADALDAASETIWRLVYRPMPPAT